MTCVAGFGADFDPRLQRGPGAGERHVHPRCPGGRSNGVDRVSARPLGLLGALCLRQRHRPLQVSATQR